MLADAVLLNELKKRAARNQDVVVIIYVVFSNQIKDGSLQRLKELFLDLKGSQLAVELSLPN